MRNMLTPMKNTILIITIVTFIFAMYGICLGAENSPQYDKWAATGKMAAEKAIALISKTASKTGKRKTLLF